MGGDRNLGAPRKYIPGPGKPIFSKFYKPHLKLLNPGENPRGGTFWEDLKGGPGGAPNGPKRGGQHLKNPLEGGDIGRLKGAHKYFPPRRIFIAGRDKKF